MWSGSLAPEEETMGTDAESPVPRMKAVPDTRDGVDGTLSPAAIVPNGTPVPNGPGLSVSPRES